MTRTRPSFVFLLAILILRLAGTPLAQETYVDSRSSGSGASMGGGADLATKSFEMTVKHASEMSEIARESGTETFNILKNRVEESLSELTGGMMGGKK